MFKQNAKETLPFAVILAFLGVLGLAGFLPIGGAGGFVPPGLVVALLLLFIGWLLFLAALEYPKFLPLRIFIRTSYVAAFVLFSLLLVIAVLSGNGLLIVLSPVAGSLFAGIVVWWHKRFLKREESSKISLRESLSEHAV